MKGFVNESGQNQIIADDFKKSLEKALLNRKSVKFEIAQRPDNSDLQISGIIKKYQYLEHDPVKPSPATATLILDTVTTENFVEMDVNFTVVETKTGKTLWKDTILSFLKHAMTPEESIPLVYDKVSRTFLWRSFGKPKRN